jgi:hypothetical protein
MVIKDFIKQERLLIKDWRATVDDLQSGKAVDEFAVIKRLNESLVQWSALSINTRAKGNIQPETARKIGLLKEYAGYRSDNIRAVIQYLNTADEIHMERLRQNNLAIRRVMEKINSPAGK